MGATVIDGKALAAAAKAEAAEKVKALKAQGINPCLAVIQVGENPAATIWPLMVSFWPEVLEIVAFSSL